MPRFGNNPHRGHSNRFLSTTNPLAGVALLLMFLRAVCAAAPNPSTGEVNLVLQPGHAQRVGSIAFSYDGRWLASGSSDHTVKVWDLARGLEFRTLIGHVDAVTHVEFSPDGRLLASASDDDTVKLWEFATGHELFTLRTDENGRRIADIAFDAGGQRLISLRTDGTVTTWDVASGKSADRFQAGGTSGPAYFMRLTRNGHWVILDVMEETTRRRQVELWDVTTGERVYGHAMGLADMNNPTPSPDGRWLASTDQHLSISLLDIAKGTMVYSLYGDPNVSTNRTFSLAFSPDGKVLAVGDDDNQTVRLLDAATGRVLRTFEKNFGDRLRFSHDGQRLAAVRDRSVTVTDLRTGDVLQTLRGYARVSGSLAISREGLLLAVGNEDNSVNLWDLSRGREVRNFIGLQFRTDSGAAPVAFSGDGRWLASMWPVEASGYLEDKLRVWESGTGREVKLLAGFKNGVTSIAFSPDSSLLAAGDYDGNQKVWETEAWKEVESVEAGVLAPRSVVAFSSNGHWLAVTRRGSVVIWDATKREWANTIRAGLVSALAFSPDSKRLASADISGKKIDVWDVESGEALLSIPAQSANSLAFSPDGRRLATGGKDHNVRLWSATSGNALRTLAGHQGEINSVAFTPNGHWLFSAGAEGSVRIWDPEIGTTVALLNTITGTNDWAVVTPDGLFDGSLEGTKKLIAWRVRDHVLSAAQYYSTHSTPGLLAQILAGNRLAPGAPIATLGFPPYVHLVRPLAGTTVHQQRVTVTVEAKDEGGGIAEVRLYHNGKLAGARQGSSGKNLQFSFEIDLIPGQDNLLKAVALGTDRVESSPDEVRFFLEAPGPPKPVLHLLVVGINDYDDRSLHLDFAQPDAQALSMFFQSHGNLFRSVKVISLFNREATKFGIQNAFDQLAETTQPEDVVLIYFAGHGFLLGQQFYFLPQDMKKEADTDAAVQKYGIPASAIGEALLRVKAVKQVLMLDACQAESALPALAKETFRTRSFEKPEERAVRMLAHASGVYLIAASRAQQYAYEVPELGHGVFTYALLAGLGEHGEPQATAVGGTVTVLSLIDYVARLVPELTEKYHMGDPQTPVVFVTGTDIPLLVSQHR
jgi:WD40 repeat protein